MLHARFFGILPTFLIFSLSCSSPEALESISTPKAEARSDYVCGQVPACDAAPPSFDVPSGERFKAGWPFGRPYHRGHDFYLQEGQEQWVIGKFSYGNLLHRQSLRGQTVKIYLLRGCRDAWEYLGAATTSRAAGENPAVAGISDEGGRIYFRIPPDKTLGLGRHRILMVVADDSSATEAFIEVLPPQTPLFVSDVDGTLTDSELAELGGILLGGRLPGAHPFAKERFASLVRKGYRPVYLTARSESLVERSRGFLSERAFPGGVLETSLAPTIGLSGEQAVNFKYAALQRLADRGFQVTHAFGNTRTDAKAYALAGVDPTQRYFYRFDDFEFGGQRIESYDELQDLDELPDLCAK